MAIVSDSTKHPLILVTATGVVTDAEMQGFLSGCSKYLDEVGLPYAFVYDGTGVRQMPATCRKLQAEWVNRRRLLLAKLIRGCGYALATPTARAALTAFRWIAPLPYPHAVFETRGEATLWCIAALVRAGDLPPAKGAQLAAEAA
jgi:hypothetical protein